MCLVYKVSIDIRGHDQPGFLHLFELSHDMNNHNVVGYFSSLVVVHQIRDSVTILGSNPMGFTCIMVGDQNPSFKIYGLKLRVNHPL